jgi:membrane-bound serine protease (ClpP class)
MTALAVALMVTGALLLIAEAHLASYGLLGVAGVLALGAGGLLAISEAGGSIVLGLAIFLPIAVGLVALMVVAGRKSLSLRRRRPRSGPQALVGRVGVVRHAPAPVGHVLVEGELWRARNSWADGEPALCEGEYVVIEEVHGLTLGVRRAEEWEVLP